MKRSKKIGSLCLVLCMVLMLVPTAFAAETETVIVLSDDGITVDGAAISQDTDAAVYVSKRTETHEDVAEELKDLENTVVTIAAAGTYRVSGALTDGQIAVSAGEDDVVTLILDGVDITCRTAPAIMAYSAYEPATVGEAGLTITLAEGSENKVTGSHTRATEEDSVKHDAAISSNVSLLIDGSGSLQVVGDNEGIEVKYKHLTINSGTIAVESQDDPINGSEDLVAHITINGGYLYCHAVGPEGDGIDSNGYLTINGGTIIALASTQSMDSGLDAEMAAVINGGTVVGAGNMFDELDADSEQLYMFLQFTESTDDLIYVTDAAGNVVFAYDFPFSYSYISFSNAQLAEGTYHVYKGGDIVGDELNGLYTNITSVSGGEQMHHGGTAAVGDRPGGMMGGPGGGRPEGMEFPEGMQPPEGMEFPEGMDRPQRPEGDGFPEGMEPGQRPEGENFPEGMEPGQRPEGGMGGGPRGMTSSGDTESFDFVLTKESRSFTNVTSAEIKTSPFEDVATDAWYFDAISSAYDSGLIVGKSETLFMPEDTVTGAELITMLYRAQGGTTDAAADGNWYDTYVAWGEAAGIIGAGGWSFAPDTALTREQMMDMLYRYMTAQNVSLTDTDDLSGFADSASISAYAREAAGKLVAAGLITGDEAGLRPADTLTRAETATILVRALAAVDTAVQIYPVSVDTSLYTAFSQSAEGYFAEGLKTGFGSAITFKGYDADGNPQFYGVTDRGPSLDLPEEADVANDYDAAKIFPAPDFTPSIGIITLKNGEAVIEESITLKNTDGTPLTGLPLPAGELGATGETALDINLQELDYDENGFDPEGIAVDADGNFWLADEYGPFIAKFSADGTLMQKYAPGDGLPEILKYRIANRGFEGLTIAPSGKIYASLQSVLDIEGETSKTATFVRIVELDPATGATKMFAYPVDVSAYKSPKNCKLGDIYALDDNTLLVIEQGELADGTMSNIVYKVDLTNATDLTDVTYDGKELEYTADSAALSGVMTYAAKTVLVDLRALGWTAEKAEGLCMLGDGNTLALIIEDDFGLAGASLNPNAGEDGQAAVLLNEISEADAAKIWLVPVDATN